MIELQLLEQLVAFEQHGTLSAASAALHLSQPSLTRSMQKLESLLGVPLFEREKNRIRLNPTGEVAADCARRVLESERDLVERVLAFDRGLRALAIGSCAPGPFMRYLPLVSSLFPGLSVTTEVRAEEVLIGGLEADVYQIIILTRPFEDEGLYCLRGETERLFLYVKRDHPVSSRGEVGFAEMNGASFLMVSEVGFWNRVVRERMPASRFLLQDSSEALAEVADSSSLPTFATNFSMDCGYVHHDRVAVPFADPEAEATYWFICKTAGRERFGRFFTALERMGRRGEER
ncbi:MAG: LysR family transcriptional regulator [Deltaproteobacteria bacterium]|nr:LysR family transcriptional regulator [Deltaproteobacteria bacterium]